MENTDNNTQQNASELDAIRQRAEVAARAAEEASGKAAAESGLVANAKKNAEDQAQAISTLRGQMEAEMSWLATTKKNAEESSNAIASAKAASDADTQHIAEIKTKIETQAAEADAGSAKGAAVLATIQDIGTGVSQVLETVKQHSAEIAENKEEIENTGAAIEALHAQVKNTASSVAEGAVEAETDGKAIEENKKKADALIAAIEKASATANVTHDRVVKYEDELKKIQKDFRDLHDKIESLLPNATSAGLASAFRNQKERFKKPQFQWLITFVVAMVLLLAAGVTELPNLFSSGPAQTATWDAILRELIVRLPLIAPLVWLGVYAGRNYMLALRVEEEYAFKEAVSTAFEGYKREMAGIASGDEKSAAPLLVLCENVLLTLAQRPGRIYEGRHEDITPLSPVRGLIRDAARARKNAETEGNEA